jgi:hypothetical protein
MNAPPFELTSRLEPSSFFNHEKRGNLFLWFYERTQRGDIFLPRAEKGDSFSSDSEPAKGRITHSPAFDRAEKKEKYMPLVELTNLSLLLNEQKGPPFAPQKTRAQ